MFGNTAKFSGRQSGAAIPDGIPQGEQELEMLMVAFKPGMAEDIFRTFTASPSHLLDEPFEATQPVHFFEQTYSLDPFIHQQFQYLRQLMDAPLVVRKELDLDTILKTRQNSFFLSIA
jgi:hypothetical protein